MGQPMPRGSGQEPPFIPKRRPQILRGRRSSRTRSPFGGRAQPHDTDAQPQVAARPFHTEPTQNASARLTEQARRARVRRGLLSSSSSPHGSPLARTEIPPPPPPRRGLSNHSISQIPSFSQQPFLRFSRVFCGQCGGRCRAWRNSSSSPSRGSSRCISGTRVTWPSRSPPCYSYAPASSPALRFACLRAARQARQ